MILPFSRNKLFKVTKWNADSTTDDGSPNVVEVTSLDEADVVSSLVNPEWFGGDENARLHTPVLDIDVPMAVVESTTPGHHHLYFNVMMTQDLYFKLLDVLAEASILEPGYAGASKARGFSAVRLPWRKKEPVGPIA